MNNDNSNNNMLTGGVQTTGFNTQPKPCPTCGTCPTCGKQTQPAIQPYWGPYWYGQTTWTTVPSSQSANGESFCDIT